MESIILGIVQGITEFLPISSSAHLLIFSWFLDGKTLSLALNVALHVGTVTAVLFYFWRDWLRLGRCGFDVVTRKPVDPYDQRLLACLVIGSIPAGIIGLKYHRQIEAIFHQTPLTSVAPLAIFGILLWWVDWRSPKRLVLDDMNWKRAFFIGVCQAIALIPGSSRSGMTITGARYLGFQRSDAARFSFLLGTPSMAGAALLEAKDILANINDPQFLLGFFSSLVVGLLAIRFLLYWVRLFGFLPFAIYRVALASGLYFIMQA